MEQRVIIFMNNISISDKYKLNNPECNCTDDDTCPLGRSSTIPRCTADDLADYVARRNRMARLEIERELAQLDNNPK